MSTQDAFLKEIDSFLERHDMAASTFGKKAMNDGKFVDRLRDGGGCTGRTMDRVRAFMRDADQAAGKDSQVEPAQPPAASAAE